MSMVIEVKLAVTGMAAYDYDPRLARSIVKAEAVPKTLNPSIKQHL